MSIENHKWDDDQAIKCSVEGDGCIEITLNTGYFNEFHESLEAQFEFNEQDAIAIAKHFNQDRESLMLEIERLIDSAPLGLYCGRVCNTIKTKDLQNLINPTNKE